MKASQNKKQNYVKKFVDWFGLFLDLLIKKNPQKRTSHVIYKYQLWV